MKNKKWISESPLYVRKSHYCPCCKIKVVPNRVKELVYPGTERAEKFDLSAYGGDNFLPGPVEVSYVEFQCPSCKKNYMIDEMRSIERSEKISSSGVTSKQLLIAKIVSSLFIYIVLIIGNIFVCHVAKTETTNRTFFYFSLSFFAIFTIAETFRTIRSFLAKGKDDKNVLFPHPISQFAFGFQFLIVIVLKNFLWGIGFATVMLFALFVVAKISDIPITFALLKQSKRKR